MSNTTPPGKISDDDEESKSHFASSPFGNDISQSITLGDENQAKLNTDTDTESNSSDEFDWDAEDDTTAHAQALAKAKRGRKAWQLFTRLARPLRIIIVAILGGGFLIAPFLVVLFRFRHNEELFQQVRAWSTWLAISWGAACLTSLTVHLLPRLIVYIVLAVHGTPPESLTTQLELLMAVSGWLKLCLDVSWTWIALSLMRAILEPSGHYWIIVNRVMQALFSATIILLVEKIFLQYVAIQFHKKALAERLAENRLALKALDRLSTAQPNTNSKRNTNTGHHRVARETLRDSFDALHPVPKNKIGKNPDHVMISLDEKQSVKDTQKQEKREKNNMKRLLKTAIVEQLGDVISQVALKDSRLNRDNGLGGLWSARRLAKKLFEALSAVEPSRSHLVVQDFHPYFPTVADAETAFALFDKDNNGDISKREMREAVQRIYRERKALTASLKDVSSAVAKLDAVLIFVALLAIAFVSLLIFNRTSTISSLVPLATIVLGFSFIFGHSAQLLFESLIFIFSTHVFDVGDLVMIDDQPLLVKEFGLFSTTFRRVDGQEIIAPNTLLATSKLIHNLRRSNSMWETTTLTIAYDTPLEAIEQLKVRLQAFVATNNREWNGVGVNIDKMEFQNSISLIIAMEHKPNWQDWGGRWSRRNTFMRNLKNVLEELEIGYSLPLQPVFIPDSSRATARAAMDLAESLGNAGSFSSGNMNRAPGPSIRVSGDTF